jgi:PAS domain-containing protein
VFRPEGRIRRGRTVYPARRRNPLVLHRQETPYLPDGSVRLLGISTDITDLKKASSQLAVNQLRYQELVECATDMIYYCDHQGFFVYANP